MLRVSAARQVARRAPRGLRGRARVYSEMHDPLDHATGIEKRELIAHLCGNCDPFNLLAFKRGPGTRQCPNLVPSAFTMRLVACSCHPRSMSISYMWLHKDEPKRCYCGYWFELVYAAPL
ncbi:Cytochrome c oxidase subunit 5B, mitochondrial [Eumeta japonica]|uniref:Cytochrome c oxidase subunit 5B, mitochondrial n=1 Tax=Eumeta variegata TaxID=151549 RepID=A0A4C1VK00_EUMVA|nr:Cytochrome c oxidase subunit 5B, mitochondrial [Eumeta japonica]